ncbi:hypothetical protein T10_12761, partial [Trichinella papuae]
DFHKFRNFVGYSLCCFRVFDENFIFKILAFFAIYRQIGINYRILQSFIENYSVQL